MTKKVPKIPARRNTSKQPPADTSWLRLIHSRYFLFATASILLVTTILWAELGARLHLQNADQLVDGYLFESIATFRDASFPAAHSFLLKWPLFAIAGWYGVTDDVIVALTVACVLATVGGLAYILWRIERRPAVIGLIYLGLSSMLLLTPYAPSPGTLIPVNMAMLTTRNVEYLVFVVAVILSLRMERLRGWYCGVAVLLFALLFASDKLFVGIAIGGALLMATVYTLARKPAVAKVAWHWLAASVLGFVGASIILWIVSSTKLTSIVSSGNAGGPFEFVTNPTDVLHAITYVVINIFNNFGANPGFDAKEFRHIPSRVAANLIGAGGLPFLLNGLMVVAGLYAGFRLLLASLITAKVPKSKKNSNKSLRHQQHLELAIALYCSLLAAVGLFSITAHNYVIDSRYLAIVLFAFMVGIAAYTVRHEIKTTLEYNKRLAAIAGMLSVGVLCASVANVGMYKDYDKALSGIADRNQSISRAIAGHPTTTLVGDYWRVLPIKSVSNDGNKSADVTPLGNCTDMLGVLSSKTWQPDLANRSFTYLLTYDGSLTNYPNCTLDQVTDAFGRPNASLTIEGSLSQPKEQLLFYDRGIHKSDTKEVSSPNQPATVVPIELDDQPYTDCKGKTIMNFVAHEDDDILFMNPDLQNHINAGDCVRTVYLTAGDSGSDESYWLSRMQGAQQAYSQMTGDDNVWIERIVRPADGDYITIASPKGNRQVSLIFMNLPDGNLHGQGFPSTGHQTLANLLSGSLPLMSTIDNASEYTSDDLTTLLTKLMETYRPAQINTQATYSSSYYPDHSDHIATSHYTQRAYERYISSLAPEAAVPTINKYIGYPIHALEPNVTGDDLERKQANFFTYGKYDPSVCKTTADCEQQAYGAYLQRQYRQ